MKKLLFALLLVGNLSEAQTLYPSGVPGCIARYDFACAEGTIPTLPDVSGNGHNASPRNLSTALGFHSRTCQAMHFNGYNSVAVVPPASSLNLQKLTIVALVKLDSFFSGNCQTNNIIYKSFSYNSPGCWAMMIDDNQYDRDCGAFSPAGEQLDFGCGAVNAPGVLPSFINPGDWYLFVTAYDGDTLTRYQILMDPSVRLSSISPIAKNKLGVTIGTNTDSVYIGATHNPSYPYNVNGDMDELVLFNRAITTSEVYSIYNYLWGAGVGVNHPATTLQVPVSVAQGSIHISNPAPGKSLNIAVFDITGKRIASQLTTDNAATVDVSGAAPGILVLRLMQEGVTQVTKVVSF